MKTRIYLQLPKPATAEDVRDIERDYEEAYNELMPGDLEVFGGQYLQIDVDSDVADDFMRKLEEVAMVICGLENPDEGNQ